MYKMSPNHNICRWVFALYVLLHLTATVVSGAETSQSGTASSQNKVDGELKYANNVNQIITLRVPGAKSYALTFTNVKTEKDFDLIKVYDGDNTLIQTISGEHAQVLVMVNHPVAEIRFTSDDSMGDEGFDVAWRATVSGDTSVDTSPGLNEVQRLLDELKSSVRSLVKTKGAQVFFDHGLVSDFSSRSFTTLQIERQYHTNNAWINLQREFICKDEGFYAFTVTGSTGSMSPTVVRIEHFSMKRQDAINNGRWIASATAIQPAAFGPISTSCIIEIRTDDKIRVQFNGTLIDDPVSRMFHLVGAKFA